ATGDLYNTAFFPGSSTQAIRRFTSATGAWSSVPVSCPTSIGWQGVLTSEWFPENNGLIMMDANSGSVYFYDKSAATCTQIFTGAGFPKWYLPVAVYNPHNQDMLIGSGRVWDESAPEEKGRTFYIIARKGGSWQFKKPDGTFTTTASAAKRQIPYVNECNSGLAQVFDTEFGSSLVVPDPVSGK